MTDQFFVEFSAFRSTSFLCRQITVLEDYQQSYQQFNKWMKLEIPLYKDKLL